MAKGARIGYWRGSIAGLIDDIQACHAFGCLSLRDLDAADAIACALCPCKLPML